MAGMMASAAILIRPNLAPLAAILVLWRLGSGAETAHQALVLPLLIGTLPGCLFIAWLNNTLYGSPLASGYGSLPVLFSLSHVATNVERYGRWLVQSQTPLAVAGIAALLWPLKSDLADTRTPARGADFWAQALWSCGRCTWSTRPSRRGGSSDSCFPRGRRYALVRQPSSFASPTAVAWSCASWRCVILVAVGAHNLYYASTHGAFPSGEGDHRYVSIAKMVEQATAPSAVIFAGQHSGAIRYYAGRTIVRFDLLDAGWLDRAVSWLTIQGRKPYFLLEEWEMTAFQERFGLLERARNDLICPDRRLPRAGCPGPRVPFRSRPARKRHAHHDSAGERARQVRGPSPLLHWR